MTEPAMTAKTMRRTWDECLKDAEFQTGIESSQNKCRARALAMLRCRVSDENIQMMVKFGIIPSAYAGAHFTFAQRLSRAVSKSGDLSLPRNPKRALSVLTAIHEVGAK